MKKKVFLGLGNPGAGYEKTYHNAGRLALGAIAERLSARDAGAEPKTYKDLFAYTAYGPLVLATPLTFMNGSGEAARAAVKKFGIKPADLVVLHDDSDLALGVYKITRGQSSAGHHGIESVMAALRAKDFLRVRIGIRPAKEPERQKASAFVLKKITARDRKALGGVFETIADELLKD